LFVKYNPWNNTHYELMLKKRDQLRRLKNKTMLNQSEINYCYYVTSEDFI